MKRRTTEEMLCAKERIERGEATPARVWSVTRGKGGKVHRRQLDPEEYRRLQKAEWKNTVAATRSKLRLSQNKFAGVEFGVLMPASSANSYACQNLAQAFRRWQFLEFLAIACDDACQNAAPLLPFPAQSKTHYHQCYEHKN